ncbi:hypothetical protein Cs7R123_45180 [Catellatospora sp. TT07R-123]|uniref:DUF6529 family protein n=1 Tax=Catellatospora sp. TT07R-123 TaxID=2733863 RepID=UPI001B095398|nr:DUF6529 family protein [Catellatospora sp. TT07R-123]GHJ47176.1 hypothetical protein Cs7R123_45180 [Catellatospora sp. TT07R-123]
MSQAPARNSARLLLPLLIGALVSVALGVYGANHRGASVVFRVSGFEHLIVVKSWLATVVTVFALVQLVSALAMYGRIRAITPAPWISTVHRWSGRIAFFAAVPIGVFCLYGIGFQHYDTRVLLHSLLGCLFFGVFTVKMLVLTRPGLAGWVLPAVGGTVFTVLVATILTSAAWYFSTR